MNASWTRYLPSFFRNRLEGRRQLQQAIGNTGWLLFDRFLRVVIGLTVGAWVARYLGPAQFGELAYVISFVAFFQVIANLQADGFIVRDIAQEPKQSSVVLGTTFWLRLVFGLCSWLISLLAISVLHPADSRIITLAAIVGATMIFQASDTVDLWFQSQSQSRRTVIAKLVSYLFSNGVKVTLVLTKAPLVAFAGTICLEAAALALSLAIAYRRYPTAWPWRASLERARALMRLCWPFLLSGLMITTYLRIDQILLKEMLDDRALGVYAAAISISQVWTVLPASLVTSLAPYVAQKKAQDERLYQEALVKIFRLFVLVALFGAIMISLASPLIIGLLYGPQYQQAALVLSVHVFVSPFISQGMAQSLWATNNNVRSVTMVSTFLAATINIIANLVLIRQFGILGAAYSILLTECAAAVIPCLFRRDLLALYKRAFFFTKSVSYN